MEKKKLIRITTSDISLNTLLKGQLKYMNQHFEVIGVSNNTGILEAVGKREGVRVVEIPMRREISLINDIICLWKLYKLFLHEKPYIIHANTPKGSLLSMIAGKLAGVKHRIYTVTGLRYQGASGLFRFLLMSMERISCACATKVIPEGNGVKEALYHDGITKKNLKVILNGNINGIDVDYFNPSLFTPNQRTNEKFTGGKDDIRKDLGLSHDDFVFVFIGRIVRDKGMNELASSLKALQQTCSYIKFLLVGRFETNMDSLSSENESFLKNSQNVIYVGYQADVRPFLIAADALVFPSYREGFPNVVLQAGAMGLPSIVTDINGCNEIITEGVNGKIIQPKDEKALYDMMMYFVSEPSEVKKMGLKCRSLIVKRYEQGAVWNAILEMYISLDNH